MKIYDFDHINKGCTVEILYGENRSGRVQRTFKVLSLDSCELVTVAVNGAPVQYRKHELRLIDKPGYTRQAEGVWIANWRLELEA